MNLEWDEISELTTELIEWQKSELLKHGKCVVPVLTYDDLLQPNDFPELENNPSFRYEEGVLAGLQMMQTALQARAAQLMHESF